MVGGGLFGNVYQGLSATGQIVAIKCIPLKESEQNLDLKSELASLRSLQHPNIVKYIDAVYQKETLDILMEYAPAGSIKSVIQNFGQINEKVAQVYTRQILAGLAFLHSKGIIHKDLKVSNVLVDNEAIIKLTDFGFTKAFLPHTKEFKESTTPMWLPPEFFTEFSNKVSISTIGVKCAYDIWSLGILVLEMITGQGLMWSSIPKDSEECFKQVSLVIPVTASKHCKEFVLDCLKFEPSERHTANDLLIHAFLSNLNRSSDKDETLKQIRYQITSLSISGSQMLKKWSKATNGHPGVIYSINSVYLSGIVNNSREGMPNNVGDNKKNDIRFSASVDSSGSAGDSNSNKPIPAGKGREEVMALEIQLKKEKEAMKKLLEGYPNIG